MSCSDYSVCKFKLLTADASTRLLCSSGFFNFLNASSNQTVWSASPTVISTSAPCKLSSSLLSGTVGPGTKVGIEVGSAFAAILVFYLFLCVRLRYSNQKPFTARLAESSHDLELQAKENRESANSLRQASKRGSSLPHFEL